MTIGIIDDDPKIRMRFKDCAALLDDIRIQFSFPCMEHLLSVKNNFITGPAVLFLDLDLPGLSGVENIPLITQMYPNSVVIAMHHNNEFVWSAFTIGAKGYVLKPAYANDIMHWFKTLKDDNVLLTPKVAKLLIYKLNHLSQPKVDCRYETLTCREQDVMNQLVKGFSYKEVANVLSLSVTTINDHVKKIYKKMNVSSKGELLAATLS